MSGSATKYFVTDGDTLARIVGITTANAASKDLLTNWAV